jgi:predicted phage baseplate assembly protein
VLTQTTGNLQFGDGERGWVPPRGTDNVKASYETGGGEAGNVSADAISDLKSSIPYVDAVTNPVSADGGADAESTDEVLERASNELRDRDRAVTEADFERIAADASRRITRTRCYSGMNPAGESESGWVTVLIVPDSTREMPVPSVTLREEVHTHVSDRAPTTLVEDPDQLVVRGPSYVAVSVAADLVTAGGGSISTLEETAVTEVSAFLHPLTGGDNGDGWAFGDAPCLSDLYGLLEAIDGVDHVADLEVEFQGSNEPVRVREGDTEPSLATDALVYSGTHEVTAHAVDDRGGDT